MGGIFGRKQTHTLAFEEDNLYLNLCEGQEKVAQGEWDELIITRGEWENLSRHRLIEKVTHLIADSFQPTICLKQLSKRSWMSLTEINLKHYLFDSWTHIKDIQAPKLTKISLAFTRGAINCQKLSQGKWPMLEYLDLTDNVISSEDFKHISQAKWNIKILNLATNYSSRQKLFGPEGCKYLFQASWHNLQHLNLFGNKIGDKGCKYLTWAQWQMLQTLDLSYNKLTNVGLKWISKNNWINIKEFTCMQNSLKLEGCMALSICNWPQLILIDIRNSTNDIYESFPFLKGNWTKLQKIRRRFVRHSERKQSRIVSTALLSDQMTSAFPHAEKQSDCDDYHYE